ncbi:hypothetical protein BH10ACI4_BH10ACI4_23490 [soil metagenome]
MTIGKRKVRDRPRSYTVLATTVAFALLFTAIVGSSIWFEASAPGLLGIVQERSVVFCLPGILGSMLLSKNIHSFTSQRVFLFNTAIYALCFYFPVRWAARRRKAR